MDRKVEYSVVIPSYNSEATIVPCLDSLTKQADPKTTEIILVDSSEDATPRLVEERFPEVTLIHFDERRSAGEARNVGIERAEGRVLLFIDSDCIADPDWISRMVAAHADGRYEGAGGGIRNGNPETLVSWAGYFLEFSPFIPTRRKRTKTVGHIPSCNVSYKRGAFGEEGGFPADMYPVEDRMFNDALKSRGGRILFDSDIQVRHFHRTKFKDLIRHQLTIGRGSAEMRRRSDNWESHLAKSPILLPLVIPLLFLGRLAFFMKRLPSLGWRLTFLWLASLPLYLLGVICWLAGFADGVCRRKRSSRT